MRTILLAALALSACSDEPEPIDEQLTTLPADDGVENTAPPPPVSPAPTTLSGAWRVAGIDGESLDEPYGLALEADDTQIWWEPRCAGMIFNYTIDGNAFASESFTDPEFRPEPGAPPPPVCAVGLPPRLSDVVIALDSADHIEVTPSNGILISGPEHSVTLYSQ